LFPQHSAAQADCRSTEEQTFNNASRQEKLDISNNITAK
jgi:hypothetical protein